MNNHQYIIVYYFNNKEYKGEIFFKKDEKSPCGFACFCEPDFINEIELYKVQTKYFLKKIFRD